MLGSPAVHRRRRSEQGFTLVELLVVILIIGILAAIAIPSFLNQKSKANDAQAKRLLGTAQTAMDTYAVDHSGFYTGADTAALEAIEPTLRDTSGAVFAGVVGTPTRSSYEVEAVSSDGNFFFITRASDGTTSRSCSVAVSSSAGSCVGGSW
jgi:type IV pilus assembly protein PilA